MYENDHIEVPASTTTVLSTKKGVLLERLILVPETLSPVAVSIKDGSGSAITVFEGGASSLTELKPIVVELQVRCSGNGWSVTTGANISVVAVGRFV